MKSNIISIRPYRILFRIVDFLEQYVVTLDVRLRRLAEGIVPAAEVGVGAQVISQYAYSINSGFSYRGITDTSEKLPQT